MKLSFWLDRWRSGTTGWHRDVPHPVLTHQWATLSVPPSASVLVPLCGATPDLAWLRSRGCAVTGVEISPLACAQFFDDQGWIARRTPAGPFVQWEAEGVTVLQGDIFDLPAAGLSFDALYDRAATIALPPVMRARYAATVARTLRPGSHGLLITMVDPARGEDGPPFSVTAEAVTAAWSAHVSTRALDPVEGQSPREQVWRLVRTPTSTA